MKRKGPIGDNERLRPDAENLAAFLYTMRRTHPFHYERIVETVRLVAPFFDDFDLRPDPLNDQVIQVEWGQRGKDAYFNAHSLSDGTLRFICIAALLLQPSPPSLVLLDEPELGLHPYAITHVADMLRASRSQVIVSTQSVTLLNQMSDRRGRHRRAARRRDGSQPSIHRCAPEMAGRLRAGRDLGEEPDRWAPDPTMIKRGRVLVEGQTEEAFVNQVLARHLATAVRS